MPCWTVQTNTVELSNVTDIDVLHDALKADDMFGSVGRSGGVVGFTKGGYRVALRNGRAESLMPTAALEKTVGEVKQAYSRHVVELAAKRFGWAVKKGGADRNRFALVKR